MIVTKRSIVKTIGMILVVLGLMFFAVHPAKAEMETNTAGASLGKDTEYSDPVYIESQNDGIMMLSDGTGTWKQDSVGKWYLYSNGTYPASAWRKIDGEWYYFNSNGYLVETQQSKECESGSIKGIDISKWQGTIDWKSVKADGVEFAFIRIGYGYYTVKNSVKKYAQELDSMYVDNIKKATAENIPVGVYIYSKARTVEDATAEAKFVIENLQGYKISYPVAIDLEDASQKDLSKEQLGKIAKAFCDEIRRAGYTPMLYCNNDWYSNYIDVGQIPDVEKWVAQYNSYYNKSIPRSIWQCSDNGRINGITGSVDIDFGYVDYTQIITPRTKALDSYYAPTEVLNGWQKIDNKWYYYNNGKKLTNWQYLYGHYYYLDPNDNGAMRSGWKYIDGKYYYFGSANDGAMKTNWQYIDGKYYYLGSAKNDGVMKLNWQYINGSYYYFGNSIYDGAMKSGWKYIDGKYYYFGAWNDGAMKYGWKYIDENYYYLGAAKNDGVMRSGWQTIDGKRYYFGAATDGRMRTGLQKIGEYWYYFGDKYDGSMKTGWQMINGVRYNFGSNGRRIS